MAAPDRMVAPDSTVASLANHRPGTPLCHPAAWLDEITPRDCGSGRQLDLSRPPRPAWPLQLCQQLGGGGQQASRRTITPWLQAYRACVKVFALTFVLGVLSGSAMSFKIGTSETGFMQTVGNIAGPLLACEVYGGIVMLASYGLADRNPNPAIRQ